MLSTKIKKNTSFQQSAKDNSEQTQLKTGQNYRSSPSFSNNAGAAANSDNPNDYSSLLTENQRRSFASYPIADGPRINYVQRKLSGLGTSSGENTSAIHQAASRGVSGTGAQLPHFATIQKAFGKHDISHVQAYTGSQAQRASRAIGAEAYATGSKIAFAERNPSLHTAAHEAAHIIQQRAGIQLKSGIGRAGDKYEKQADTVADKIVQGQSVEHLLDKQTIYSASALNANGQGVQNKLLPNNLLQLRTVDRPDTIDAKTQTDIDVEKVSAVEMIPDNKNGFSSKKDFKTTELSALLIPDIKLQDLGAPTQSTVNPMGWNWIETTEKLPSSKNPQNTKIKYWVRFHLLNAKIGGDGRNPLHLTPTRKTTNSQWEVNIEHAMKDAIKGDGTFEKPNGKPIYYKVNLEYWKKEDAPDSYNMSAGGKGGTDFRHNITLFPRNIHAEWYIYDKDKKQWGPKLLAKTGDILPKPAGLGGGRNLELIKSTSTEIANTLSIPKLIVDLLQEYYSKEQAPTHYSKVREVLEEASMKGNASNFVKINEYIFDADSNLRSALNGSGRNTLTINGKEVKDDGIREAQLLSKPVVGNLRSEEWGSYFAQFAGINPEIIRGYQQTLKELKNSDTLSVPQAEEVISEIILAHLNSQSLQDVKTTWDNFIANNMRLPAMKEYNFAEGEEIAHVVYNMTIRPIKTFINSFTNQTSLPSANEILKMYADELIQNIDKIYLDILNGFNISGLEIRVVRGVKSGDQEALKNLFAFLVEQDKMIYEFYWRVRFIISAFHKKIDIRNLFKNIQNQPIDPKTIPLRDPFVNEINSRFDEENQKIKQQQQSEIIKQQAPNRDSKLSSDQYKQDLKPNKEKMLVSSVPKQQPSSRVALMGPPGLASVTPTLSASNQFAVGKRAPSPYISHDQGGSRDSVSVSQQNMISGVKFPLVSSNANLSVANAAPTLSASNQSAVGREAPSPYISHDQGGSRGSASVSQQGREGNANLSVANAAPTSYQSSARKQTPPSKQSSINHSVDDDKSESGGESRGRRRNKDRNRERSGSRERDRSRSRSRSRGRDRKRSRSRSRSRERDRSRDESVMASKITAGSGMRTPIASQQDTNAVAQSGNRKRPRSPEEDAKKGQSDELNTAKRLRVDDARSNPAPVSSALNQPGAGETISELDTFFQSLIANIKKLESNGVRQRHIDECVVYLSKKWKKYLEQVNEGGETLEDVQILIQKDADKQKLKLIKSIEKR